MKLNQLKHFIAVAQRGSVRSAARHLSCAQPAITRSIHELERALGAALFERRAKGMVLTSVGEVFLRRAVCVREELRRLEEEVNDLSGNPTGTVSMGLSTASHIALLPYALQQFKTRYPDVVLDIAEGLLPAMEPGLLNGTLDFYVGPLTESPLSKELSVEKLFDNFRLIFGRKGHPLSGAKSLSELAGAKWIGTSVTVATDAELGPLFKRMGLEAPRIDIQAHFALTMIMAAASSDLLTMLPQQWRFSPLASALLHTFEIRESLPAPAICIVRRTRLPLTPAAEYFCDMVRRGGPASSNRSTSHSSRRYAPLTASCSWSARKVAPSRHPRAPSWQ